MIFVCYDNGKLHFTHTEKQMTNLAISNIFSIGEMFFLAPSPTIKVLVPLYYARLAYHVFQCYWLCCKSRAGILADIRLQWQNFVKIHRKILRKNKRMRQNQPGPSKMKIAEETGETGHSTQCHHFLVYNSEDCQPPKHSDPMPFNSNASPD